MSKLQTYISERKKSFRENFVRDDGLMDKYTYLDAVDENGIPETVTNADAIEAFNEETIEGVMAIVREWAEENAKEVSDPYPFEGQYIDLIILSELLQALNTKEY